MKRRTLVMLMLTGALLAGCGPGGGAKPADTLVFSAIPGEKATQLEDKFDKLAVYLSDELGIAVEYKAAIDYDASVSMFRNGDVHLAWFGGLTGVQAREAVAGARAIVQGAEDPRYHSYFIVHDSVEIERSDTFPAAVATLPFTFGSKLSTSGRLMPEYFIRTFSGKGPKDFFSNPVAYSGAHPKTVEAVAAGTSVKAGAVSYTTYDRMARAGQAKGTKIVWQTPDYADYNFTVHPVVEEMFGEGFVDRLQAALIGLDDREILDEGFARSKLVPALNADFDKIRRTAIELGFVETD